MDILGHVTDDDGRVDVHSDRREKYVSALGQSPEEIALMKNDP